MAAWATSARVPDRTAHLHLFAPRRRVPVGEHPMNRVLRVDVVVGAQELPGAQLDVEPVTVGKNCVAWCDVVTVQRSLGHAKATTTLNTYAHLWPTAEDRTRKAAESIMSASLGPPAAALAELAGDSCE